MASILDLLNTSVGKELINKVTHKTSADKSNISSVLGMALPVIMGALNRNVKDPEGAQKLDTALQDEQHGEDYLNKLNSIPAEDIANKGGKILDHILGDKQEKVNKTISGLSQVNESTVSSIIKMAAPVVMSLLASQKRKDSVGASGLSGLLQSVLGSTGKHDASFLETLLDKNHDGSIIDDVSGMILGGNNSKGKSDLLGGMLGGK